MAGISIVEYCVKHITDVLTRAFYSQSDPWPTLNGGYGL